MFSEDLDISAVLTVSSNFEALFANMVLVVLERGMLKTEDNSRAVY